MESSNRIANALFLLRLGVFVVMFMWTIDKFINPDHAAAVYQSFYFLGEFSATIFLIIGALEMLILIGFLLGIKKTITYGLVLAFHTVSTVSTWAKFLDPFEGVNLLFFAAIPMLAACWALFSLRDLDTKFTVG